MDKQARCSSFHFKAVPCSKGIAVDDPLKTSPDDVSTIAHDIEAELLICYLETGEAWHCYGIIHTAQGEQPRIKELTLSPAPMNFPVFTTAAAEEAFKREVSFSVMYTPFLKGDKADKIKEANKNFAKEHPDYMQHIFTDPHRIHTWPDMVESLPACPAVLTDCGFQKQKNLERSVTRKLPIFSGQKASFSPTMEEEIKQFGERTGEKYCHGFYRKHHYKNFFLMCDVWWQNPLWQAQLVSSVMERFHFTNLPGLWQREEEQPQVMNQVMAELVTIPACRKPLGRLQSLMADAMDILEGRSEEHVWTKIEKVKSSSKGQESILLLGE
ncbi:spermatogenesis-associated protein 16 [Passer domesticus]|uniref:spermatogenesis-associated protein 16 n=1 Tax=Passer domesticus TaxID=48849 RepID=UPI0030FE877B